MSRLAIVTGANRGIGFEVCRQLAARDIQVILTCRSVDKGEEAAQKLKDEGHAVVFHPLDVSDPASIQSLFEHVESKFGWLNILVNNAGILLDSRDESAHHEELIGSPADMVSATFQTNTLGPYQMSQLALPLMRRAGYGRIVNVSSGMGQLSEMGRGYAAYRISKTALNAVTKIFAEESQGTNVLVNSVCPGWVKTDMGGAGATRPVEQGAETIVWAAMLPDNGPNGGFFRDKKPIAW